MKNRNPAQSEKPTDKTASDDFFVDGAAVKLTDEAKFFLASIVESSGDSIVTIDLDATITSWNKSAERVYGYPANEAIGKPLTMLTLPEDLAEIFGKIEDIKQSRKVEIYDTVRVRKSGREINLEIVLSPVKDDNGKIIGVSTIARDITERKLAEKVLRESEEKLRLFVTAVSDTLYRMSADWKEMIWLEGMKFLASTGKPSFSWMEFYIPDSDKPLVQAKIEEAVRTKVIFEVEHRVIRADSSIGWTFSRAVPLLDETGEIIEWFGAASDITIRKKAEEALRESEERLAVELADTKNLQAVSGQLIRENDINALYEKVIDAAIGLMRSDASSLQIFRREKNAMQLLAWKGFAPESAAFWEWVSPDGKSTCGAAVGIGERVIVPDVEACDFMCGTEDLEHFHLSGIRAVQSTPLVSRSGNVVGMISTHWNKVHQPSERELLVFDVLTRQAADLIERGQAEQALLESETRLRLALEASEMATWEWHLKTGEVFWNDRHFLLFGMEPHTQPVTAEDFFRHVHVNDRRRISRLLQKAIAEKSIFDADFCGILESGKTRWMSGFGRVVEESAEGEPLRMSGVMFDIDDRKKAVESLRESEERLRLLVESAEDYAIFTMTQKGIINSWNTGAEKIFGWAENEIVGQPVEIIFTPEDRQKGEPEKERKTALRYGRAPDERYHLRKDSSRFYVSGVTTTLKGENGKVLGLVKIARDMTEQLKTEKALRDKEMLQKLVGAQEEERRRIARDLHDELGQQLTALRLNLEKTRKMCEDENVRAEIDKTELLAKSIDNGVDFLAWELRPAALDQFGLIPALDNYVKQWTHFSGIRAELLASSLKKRRFAREIETNLYRIVQEALNNIHKHARAENVEVLLEKRGELIVLIIQDDGKGFNVKNKKTRSKGIGLIGMQERAELIGGTLEIESAPGAGTTIFVRVPVLSAKKRRF